MAIQLFTNNATTLLDADIDNVVTALTVTGGDGALFPNPTSGDWFYATIEQGATIEIVQVTTRATDSFSVIVRAQDGTSAASFTAGATIELRVSAAFLNTIITSDTSPDSGDVTGPAVAVDDHVAFFDGTTGKLIKTNSLPLTGTNTGDQTLPIDSTITVTDVTDNDADTAAHGWMPKGDDNARHFYNGDLLQVRVPGWENNDPVVNPGLNLWQFGNSFTGIATAAMIADQYEIEYVTSVGVMDASRVTPTLSDIFTAAGQRIRYALRVDVTTIDASIAAAEFVTLSQKIEGLRAQLFMHKQHTVSFFVRSNLTGQFAFAEGNDGDDRNFIKTFSPAVADTWERISITVAGQDLTGTWDYLEGIGLNLRWALVGGSDHEATDNIWNSTADFVVSGQENFLSSTSNYFELTGVQIDLGAEALAYRGVMGEEDIHAAERYFQKSYDLDVAPAATSALGQVVFRAHGTNHLQHVAMRTPMRKPPTVVLYNPTDGTPAEWEDVGAAAGVAMTSANIGRKGFEANITTSVDLNEVNGHWTAQSKL